MTSPVAEPAPLAAQREALEALASQAYGDQPVTEVVRPAAILPEAAARLILAELLRRDARRASGLWVAEPARWERYDLSWDGPGAPGRSQLLGSLQVVYGRPGQHDITVFRATITSVGAAAGWSVQSLCDEAFSYGGLTLASCPRAALTPPPQPFRHS